MAVLERKAMSNWRELQRRGERRLMALFLVVAVLPLVILAVMARIPEQDFFALSAKNPSAVTRPNDGDKND